MDEKKEEVKEDEPETKEDKPETSTLVDDTNLAAKRMEDATAAAKEERLAGEESYSKMKLSGETEAGQTSEPKEETPKEYNARIEKEISEGKHDN